MENNNTPTNELAVTNKTAGSVYCSVKANTVDEKKKLFNALENCDHLLNDCVDEIIKIKDVYIETYNKEDEVTGETRIGHRTIIFSTEGISYVTASNYLCATLTKMLTIFGTPDTWSEPLAVKVVKKPVKGGNPALSLKLVDEDDK